MERERAGNGQIPAAPTCNYPRIHVVLVLFRLLDEKSVVLGLGQI